MKKFFFVLTLLVAAVGVSNAQVEKAKAAAIQDSLSGPVMKFEAEVVDYGEIELNSDPYREFTFTNVGDEPLVIKNAKGSCGCTVPDAPQEPILPGETAKIKVRYDTRRPGPFTKTITLTTNAAEERKILRIKGDVKKAAPGLPEKTSNGFNKN